MSESNGHTKSLAEEFGDLRAQWAATVNNRYRMARTDRFTKRLEGYPEGVSADHNLDSESDYFLMVERARELDREDIVAGAVVSRLVGNVLQNGFMLTPASESPELNSYIKLRWEDWCESPDECDEQREHTFHQLAEMSLRDVIVPGDVIVLPLESGPIQVLENHRLRTPRGAQREMTVMGVELNGSRQRVAYWITEDDIELNKFVHANQARRIEARDADGNRQVFHIFHPKRVSQTRGVTKFAATATACAMHDDIQFSKLVQQQSVSVWTMIRERQMGFEMPAGFREPTNFRPDPGATGQLQALRGLSAGMMYTGYPGELIKGFSPNVPNPTFFDHAKQVMQLIAINLDVPLVMLLLDASETNYSGWRGALEQAKIAYRNFQSWFAGEFHEPIYTWKMRQWSDPRSPLADPFLVAARASGFNVFAHDWVYPTWFTTEPLTDSTDRLLRTANNMASLRRVHAEVGQDFMTEIHDIIEDRAMAIELAIERAEQINQRFPGIEHPVTWMQLAGGSLPEGMNFNLQADLTPEQPAAISEKSSNGTDR